MKAYTLIELATIISIILILAAFAIPSFVSLRDRAVINAAKEAMHSLRLAEVFYKQDTNRYTDKLTELYKYGRITPLLKEFATTPTITINGEYGFIITATAKDKKKTPITATEKEVLP